MKRQPFFFTYRYTRQVVDLTQPRGVRTESLPVVVKGFAEQRTLGGEDVLRVDIDSIWNGINNLFPFLNFRDELADIEAAAHAYAMQTLKWEKEAVV